MLRTSVRIEVPLLRRSPGKRRERDRGERHEHEAEADALDDAGDDDGLRARCRAVNPII